MLEDGYGNPVTTRSDAARAAYVEGCGGLLRLWPGGAARLERAVAVDPGFALAHAALARARQLAGDMAGARTALAAAQAAPVATEREASHIAVFDRLIAGQPAAALDLIRRHMADWPRDAFIAALAANQTGLIGMSGRAGREAEQLAFLEHLLPHYPDDPWFDSHYAMSLSELGHHDAARPRIERSLALLPQNAYAAHACAHLHYETDAAAAGNAFLTGWLADYPPEGALRGHLSWHLALVHLGEGRMEEGLRLFDEAFASDDYRGPALIKMLDAPSFLWRLELAGQPHDADRWLKVRAFADRAFPAPGIPFADWHVALTDAATGRDPAARIAAIEALDAAGRYNGGPTVPAAARGFAAFAIGDWPAAIAALESMIDSVDRLAGSRAQLDLLEFTLLRAYLAAGQVAEARRLIDARRRGPRRVPVAGIEAALST